MSSGLAVSIALLFGCMQSETDAGPPIDYNQLIAEEGGDVLGFTVEPVEDPDFFDFPICVEGPCQNNLAPVANAGADQSAAAGLMVALVGNGSFDLDGCIEQYRWTFGDGQSTPWIIIPLGTPVPTTYHAYAQAGTYSAKLWVKDHCGAQSASDTAVINITDCGGNTPPVAAFSNNPSAPASGQSVSFSGLGSYDPDGQITSYAWNWGDGTPNSSGINAMHVFSSAGSFSVTLTVTDNFGCTDVHQSLIYVASNCANSASPTANFDPPASVVEDQPVSFDGSSSSDPDGSITTYTWNWGDGTPNTGSVSAISSHTFANPGTYSVTLTVLDNCGKMGSKTKSVVVSPATNPCVTSPAPSASFTHSPGSVQEDQTVAFDASASSDSDGTIVGYTWSWGDGTPDTNGVSSSANHVFANPGTYTVRLTVTDDCAKTGTYSKNVVVAVLNPCLTSPAPIASFMYSPTNVVEEQAVSFNGSGSVDSDGSIVGYSWSWGDGTPDTNGVSPSTTHVFANPGTYNVRLTVTDNCGKTGTQSKNVVVAQATVPEPSGPPQLVSFVPGVGEAFSVAVSAVGSSNYAFVASPQYGLSVVNITSPTSPVLAGTLSADDMPASAMNVAAGNGYAMIGSPSSATTRIVDVSVPSEPVVVGALSAIMQGGAIDNFKAYICTGSQLRIHDLNQSGFPLIGTVNISARAVKIAVVGSDRYAFVAAGSSGLQVVRVTNPASPTLLNVSQSGYSGSATHVAVHQSGGASYAYIAADGKVYAYNASTPTSTSLAGNTSLGFTISGLACSSGKLVVCSAMSSQFRVFGLQSPGAPAWNGTLAIYCAGVDFGGGYAIVGGGTNGLRVVNISNASSPTVATTVVTPMTGRTAVAIEGNLVLAGGPSDVVRAYQIDSQMGLTPLATLPIYAQRAAIDSGYAYFCTGVDLKIVNPAGFSTVAAVPVSARAVQFQRFGDANYALVAAGTAGLKVVNVTQPSSPSVVSANLPTGTASASDVALYTVAGATYAYVAASDGAFYVFNVTNPVSPSYVGAVSVGVSLSAVTVANSCLLVGSSLSSQLRCYSLSNPTAPVWVDTLALYVGGLTASGQRVYVAGGTNGLRVIDVSVPSDLRVEHVLMTPGDANSFAIDDGFGAVGNWGSVVNLVDLGW